MKSIPERLKLRSDLVRPPTMRTNEEGGHRHATWLELFTDLAFVAAVGQVAVSLSDQYNWAGLLKALVLFVPIWWAWVGNTFYLSRFDSDDLVHRIQGLVHIGMVAMLAVGVPGAMGENHGTFALAYALIRVLLIFQYLLAGKHNAKARSLTTLYAWGFSVSPILWLISITVPQPAAWGLWLAGVLFDLSVPLWRNVRKMQLAFPPSEHHVPERFGLFTIIVLGEAILAAVTAAQLTKGTFDFWVIGLLGLVLAFSVWWIYFEGVKGSDARVPSSREDIKRYQLWFYSHLPLQFAIVVMAVGVKLAMKGKDGALFVAPAGTIFLLATFLCMTACHLIYLSSLDACLRRRFFQVSWPYIVLTALTPFVGWLCLGRSAVWEVGAMAAMFLGHVFLTFRENRLPTDPPRHSVEPSHS